MGWFCFEIGFGKKYMILRQLTGKEVVVTLGFASPIRVKGVYVDSDDSIIQLEQGGGKPDIFVPLNAILHIEPVQD